MTDRGLVLILDDDDSVRKALANLCRTVDLDVETFSTASAFLARPRPARPTCLLLDLRMPGTSGLAVQEWLARAGDDLPIIFLTGHADVATTVRAMKAGAVDLLEKPFNDQNLLDAVHRALARAAELTVIRTERERVTRLVAGLTRREREVLALVVTGIPNKQVADRLGAAERTIKVHRARVMKKMGADSLAHLVRLAQVVGIKPPESRLSIDSPPRI